MARTPSAYARASHIKGCVEGQDLGNNRDIRYKEILRSLKLNGMMK